MQECSRNIRHAAVDISDTFSLSNAFIFVILSRISSSNLITARSLSRVFLLACSVMWFQPVASFANRYNTNMILEAYFPYRLQYNFTGLQRTVKMLLCMNRKVTMICMVVTDYVIALAVAT